MMRVPYAIQTYVWTISISAPCIMLTKSLAAALKLLPVGRPEETQLIVKYQITCEYHRDNYNPEL
jgi:hypothetical protein